MAHWRTKTAISLKRVKIEEKLLWGAYRNSPTPFRTVSSPTPYGLHFPEIGVCTTPAKFNRYYTNERVKPLTSTLADTFTGCIQSSKQKPIKIFREQEAWTYPGTAHFFAYPLFLLSQECEKLGTSNSARTFIGIYWNKSPLKFWKK